MRAVKCVVGPYGSVVDDTECNAATRPTETQVQTRYNAGLIKAVLKHMQEHQEENQDRDFIFST